LYKFTAVAQIEHKTSSEIRDIKAYFIAYQKSYENTQKSPTPNLLTTYLKFSYRTVACVYRVCQTTNNDFLIT